LFLSIFFKLYERNRNQKIEKREKEIKKEEKAAGKPNRPEPDSAHGPSQ
jgi:hypothetical protein